MEALVPVQTKRADYYEVLGVAREADRAAIDAAYKARVLEVRDAGDGGESVRRLGLAHRALRDPERRRDYDDHLAGAKPPAAQQPAAAQTTMAADADVAQAAAGEGVPADAETFQDDGPHRPRAPRRAIGMAAGLGIVLLAGTWAMTASNEDRPKFASAEQPSDGPGGRITPPNSVAERPSTGQSAGEPVRPADAELVALRNQLGEQGTVGSSTALQGQSAASGLTGPVAPVADATAPPVATPQPEATPTTPSAPEPSTAPAPSNGQVLRIRTVPPPTPTEDRSAPARWVSGGLQDSDNRRGRFEGTVRVRMEINAAGRVGACRVARSSGDPALDSATCSILRNRLQFSAARDSSGQAIPTEIESSHSWGRRPRSR